MTAQTQDPTRSPTAPAASAPASVPVSVPVSVGSVLLTVGTGKTGRRVAARLEALGVHVRAGSRSGAAVASPSTGPSATARFDWTDPSTWAPALAGVDAADPEAATHWAAYLRAWVAWNHVRTAAALAAGAALTLAAAG